MDKIISCGGIIMVKDEVLLGLPSLNRYWNLPKGCTESGETPIMTAVREIQEESNIDLTGIDYLYDFGQIPYLKDKDLHLFLYALPEKPADLRCNTYFPIGKGNLPEMRKFKWVRLDDVGAYLGGALKPLVLSLIPTIKEQLNKLKETNID